MPATLFLNSRWIDANPAVFRRLAGEPLFEIANHGTRHLPLSVTGRSAYGITGTRDAGQVYDEVAQNQALTRLLGVPPRFFRAGTAYSDDVAAQIVTAMGDHLVTFSVNGDAGASFAPWQVQSTVTAAPAGSVVLCHMNHPGSGTAPGIAAAVPAWPPPGTASSTSPATFPDAGTRAQASSTSTLVGLATTSNTAERFCDCAISASRSSREASASMANRTVTASKPLRTSGSAPRMPRTFI